MRRSVFEHFDDRAEHAADRAERRIGFMEAAQTVEMTKEFVSAVDKMNDHQNRVRRSAFRSETSGRWRRTRFCLWFRFCSCFRPGFRSYRRFRQHRTVD